MDLPDFDCLAALAKNNPEELEALRCRCNQQIIDEAPEYMKRRLKGLLFQINMEKRRSKNSMQCCIKYSQLMMDSFFNLHLAITDMSSLKNGREIMPMVDLGIVDLDMADLDVADLNNVIYFPVKDKSGHA